MLIRRRTAAVFAAATLIAIALGGCAEQTPSADPTRDAPSTSPTPTPTAATVRPALADLVLSTSGLGPLVVGSPVPLEPADVAVVSYNPVGCLGDGSPLVEGDPGAGRWAPNYPDERPFDVVTASGAEDGAISRILVAQPFVATEAGIRVGSTLEELLAAYPAITIGPEELVGLYTIEDSAGMLVFEAATDAVIADYWTPEQLNSIVYITAYAPGETVSPVYATDSAGSCPV